MIMFINPHRDFELSDDLMSESAKSAQLKYTLIAVINHTGDMKGGHCEYTQ